LQVAALAGVPKPVLNSAKAKLAQLEASSLQTQGNLEMQNEQLDKAEKQIDLALPEPVTHKAVTLLESVDPDDLSPKQALAMLYQLKEQL